MNKTHIQGVLPYRCPIANSQSFTSTDIVPIAKTLQMSLCHLVKRNTHFVRDAEFKFIHGLWMLKIFLLALTCKIAKYTPIV